MFSKIPFIAGTVLDEGTYFTSTTISSGEEVVEFITLADQPFIELLPPFQKDVAKLLQLYPDNPALGSPFGTGNETFGLSSQYKRASAILGDALFQASRHEWIQSASKAVHEPVPESHATRRSIACPCLGSLTVAPGSEVTYVSGLQAPTSPNLAVRLLSAAMVDYWISFTVSLTPKDGKRLNKTIWPQYKSGQQVLLQFDTGSFAPNATNATFAAIPDDCRTQQKELINSIACDLGE